MKKNLFIVFVLSFNIALAQKKVKLFFVEDSTHFNSCGVMEVAHVLFFTTDTLLPHKEDNYYKIIVICPDIYGAYFFIKNKYYELLIGKVNINLNKYFSPSEISFWKKKKKLYLLKKIKKLG
jgi:hypothetical protein